MNRFIRSALPLVVLLLSACGGSGEEPVPAQPAPPAQPTAPVIGTQPKSLQVLAGQRATFTVAAAGSDPLAYQWRRDGADIGAATQPAYTLAQAQANDDGARFTVRVSNGAGSVESDVATLAVAPPPPPGSQSSFELIEAARGAGTIDAETALRYRVYATFRDARLPVAYAGNDAGIEHSSVLTDLQQGWESLSPATQQILGPFLMPPAYAGSGYQQAAAGAREQPLAAREQRSALEDFLCARPEFDPNWASVPLGSVGNVRVWYDTRVPNEGALAIIVASIANDEVWPKLFGALGMKHPRKDKTPSEAYEGCNGGDERLDIYLQDLNTGSELAWTKPVGISRTSPVFILLKRTLTDEAMRSTLAHELMHASQYAYDAKSRSFDVSHKWLREATAAWAIDHVYPGNNYEQTKALDFLANPEESLEVQKAPGASSERRMYGSYLFFQYVANRGGGASRIPLIWSQTEVLEDQLEAVDAGLLAGFTGTWHQFAKQHWNQDPVHLDSYDAWDPPAGGAATLGSPRPYGGAVIAVALGGQASREYEMNAAVKHLAIHYHHFDFTRGGAGIDPNLRSFTLEHSSGLSAHVQAFVKKEGSIWQVEDWTPGEGDWQYLRRRCFDVKAERLEGLVVIVSNGYRQIDLAPPAEARLRLGVNNLGCWRWKGTASSSFGVSQQGISANVEVSTTEVVWERVPPPAGLYDAMQSYKVISGRFAASYRAAAAGGCKHSADVSGVSVLNQGGEGHMTIQNYGLSDMLTQFTEGGLVLGGYSGRAYSSGDAPGVLECMGRSDPAPYPALGGDWFKAGEREVMRKSTAQNGLLSDSFTIPDGNLGFTWRFEPLREP